YEPSHDAMRHLLQVFVANKDMISDDLVEMRYRASVRAGVQERFSALFPAPRQRWIEALAQDPEVLRQIKHQVLLIHGYEDEVIPFAASERLVSLLPNAKLERIDRCGHWVQIEQAEQFNKILGEFMSAP
ncbi:MAG: alpha/beta fold hydrolase, partial [Rhodospirillales bacterium]